MSKSKRGKILYYVIMLVLIAVFLVSAIMLIDYAVKSWKSQSNYNELQEIVNQNRPTKPAKPKPTGGTPRPTEEGRIPEGTEPEETTTEATLPPLVTITDPETGKEMEILREYAELYKMNTDLVGWMEIPGTRVSYPVVQRPEWVDYYLHRDFYGNYDPHGCLYAREQCDVAKPSDNITIYGHRMKDGTMMGDVGKYELKSFWEENQYIYFDTLTEHHTYQIVYVFKTTASLGEGFQYHLFVDARNENEFNNFVNSCKANALYYTGLEAQFGDKLITLSTCEYTLDNGRLVVVAKRID